MRIAVEYIFDTQKILVRLLAEPASPVLVGSYIVYAFPQIKNSISFDIESEQVVGGEAKVYLTGWYPLPEKVVVTLPDLTTREVLLQHIKTPSDSPAIAEQKTETIEKVDHPPHTPAHAEFKPDKMRETELPPFWFEFNGARADAFRAGLGLTSGGLQYTGGVAGRALESKIVQEAQDFPPFKQGAPTRLEGAFTNNLPNSDFTATSVPYGFIDPFPTGWGIVLHDTDNWLRTRVNYDSQLKLPHVELTWYQRPGYIDLTEQPPVTITTTAVPAAHFFQVLAVPSSRNSVGTLQLKSATGMVSTPAVVLGGEPLVLRLNVGADPGPVKIIWNQTNPNSDPQTLTLLAPMSTQYGTQHSYVPEGATSAADLLQANAIGGVKWGFSEGYIRLDSEQEILGEPLSWTLKFSSGPVLLQVQDGQMSSDFSTSPPFNLASFLPPVLETAGSYKLRWRWGEPFQIFTRVPEQPETEQTLPLVFDLPVSDLLLNSTMDLILQSYTSIAGSSRIKYFVFKPKDRPQ